ncbi:hypothetical protein DPMN_118631 [Dreissena polymorpha]|uniref:RBR-type E3 ubiquitin transferase n=1 Tax=Dreissena polymorpha TaxID=45954 RepID=A0A9D4JR94_DREPO|nr:hypothetical protein DPMN_118631 [Dreissena polymorpha]
MIAAILDALVRTQRLRLIKNCETKTVFGVECPAIRACPSCGMLIEHKEACKHMHCRCSQKFCFICLEKSDSGGQYQCGAWNATCTPAPRQTSVPGQ